MNRHCTQHLVLALLAIALPGVLSMPGCVQTWKTTKLTPPSEHVVVRGQLEVHSDFLLPRKHRLLDELTARRHDLSRQLGLPPEGEPISIYLFEDRERFTRFMNLYYPQFPDRRAFFVKTDTRLEVYAHWGDRVAEDLRHEVTHGYLHSVIPSLPLWLDEGLAEYYEVARGHRGLNRQHLQNLLARLEHDQWQPSLARMEGLDRPFEMTLDDYAESWAWVHFMLQSQPQHRQLLRFYLADLRQYGSASPLGMRLEQCLECPESALVAHIRRLAADSR